MKSPLIHVASLVFDTPLAILPERLEAILHTIGPRLDVDQTALNSLFSDRVLRSHITGDTPQLSLANFKAYWDDDEDERDNSKPYKVTNDGIAIIPISGALTKKGSWLSALCGFSSYAGVSRSIKMAMEDPSVKGVLFNSDSPGGTTHGCFECADLIHSYRGTKPMFGVANDLAASAAYALLSSCDRIYVTRTGAVGSIGVFCVHVDQSGYDEKLGAKYTYVHAGKKKVDGNPHEPLSRSAKADMQAEVDREWDIFVSTVARNRSVSAEKIYDTEAGVSFAENAVPLLADKVGTYDDALADVTKKVSGTRTTFTRASTSDPAENSAVASETKVSNNVPSESERMNANTLSVTESSADVEKTASTAKMPDEKCKDDEHEEPDGDETPDGDEPDTDTDEDDEEEQDEKASANSAEVEGATTMPEQTTTAAAAANDPKALTAAEQTQIATVCTLAGHPEEIAGFLSKQTPVADVIAHFQNQRAAESQKTDVTSRHTGGGQSSALDTLENQAIALARSANITKAQAYTQILTRNPRLYDQYVEQHNIGVQALGSKPTVSQLSANPYMQSLYSRFSDAVGGIGAGVTPGVGVGVTA